MRLGGVGKILSVLFFQFIFDRPMSRASAAFQQGPRKLVVRLASAAVVACLLAAVAGAKLLPPGGVLGSIIY